MPLTEKEAKYLYAFLVISIAIGIFVRFYGIGESYLEGDEPSWMASEIKLHHSGAYDPRFYLFEHPPVARWFIGLPTSYIDADYTMTVALPPEMYVWAYFVPFREVYVPMREVSAVFGLLSVVLIFLITKEIYGTKAGIWSATLAALSFDLIFYSRWVLSESVSVGMTLLTFYCYMKYLKEKRPAKRLTYMVATMIFFTLALGTRIFTPMFLIPVLFISQFLINKGKAHIKENIFFTTLLLIGTYITFYIIWPPPVRDLAQNLDAVKSVSDVVGFTVPTIILNNIFRNSYLYVFGLALLIYQLFNFLKVKADNSSEAAGSKSQDSGLNLSIEPAIEYLKSSNISIMFTVLLAITLLGFGFTKYTQSRYHLLIFIAIFILAGKPLEKAGENKKIALAMVFLVMISFFFFAKMYPYYADYQNFDLGKCGSYAIACNSEGGQIHIPELKQAMSYLAGLDNPGIITNEANMLIFYKGRSIPLLAPGEPRCTQNETGRITDEYKYIIYKSVPGQERDIQTNPYVCQTLRETPMEIVASFGNYTNPTTGAEDLRVRVYKIGGIQSKSNTQDNSTKAPTN